MKLRITVVALIAMLALSACDPASIPGGPTIPTIPTTPTTTPAPEPASISNLSFDGYDVISDDISSEFATFNLYFSWDVSSTPNVKYCVLNPSYTSTDTVNWNLTYAVEGGCTWDNPYLSEEPQAAFGLHLKKATSYEIQVTAIDSNNRKSEPVTLNWETPTTSPAPVSNLQFDRFEYLGGNEDGPTNAWFKWDASPTPGVKYCLDVESESYEGGPQWFNENCDFNNNYLKSDTFGGFGLVWEKGTTYQMRVTAIDSNNRKSIPTTISWMIP